MGASYIPNRDADLVGFAQNLSTKLTATPTAYGITAAQATAFDALFVSFRNAFFTIQDPSTSSAPFVAAKNTAKEALIENANGIRALVALIQAHPGITDEQLLDLRLTVRDREPTPLPPPATAPVLEIVSNVARTVKIRLHDSTSANRRGKPAGVQGATIFSFVGDEAPSDLKEWKFEASTTRTVLDVEFPVSVADGAKVWLTAFWYNPRAQSGPACAPVSTRILGGLSMAA